MLCSATSSRVLALLGATLLPVLADAATVERRLGVMGTSLHLAVTADDRAVALQASEAAVLAVERTEQRLSTWRHDTELARLNRTPVGESMTLSEQTASDLRHALTCAQATAGAFDPTVGALVEAWELRGRGRIPDAGTLRRAGQRTGHGHLGLEDGVATRRADVLVEEGGFGKGAALDWAEQALKQSGATGAWMDLGGQVLVFGREAVVSIAHPSLRGTAALELVLSAGSIATTGNSERGLRVDGRRIGHVLDPRTARPAAEVGSVTVVARSGTWADCLSTALYVLGPEAALAWARQRPDVEVVVLQPSGTGLRGRASAGLRGLLRAAPGVNMRLEFDDNGEAK